MGRILKAVDLLIRQAAWKEADAMFARIRDVNADTLTEEEKLTMAKLESKVAWANGKETEAIGALEGIVKANPVDGDAQLILGEYYSKTGKPEQAVYRYEIASRIEGFEADAFVKHAQLLVREQKYTEALDLLRKAQKVKPRDHVQRFLEKVELAARTKRTKNT